MIATLSLLAAALYVLAGVLLLQRLRSAPQPPDTSQRAVLAIAVAASLIHAWLLYASAVGADQFNAALPTAISLAAWAIVLLFLLATAAGPAFSLGVFVLPGAALAVLAGWLMPARDYLISGVTPAAAAHMIIAVLAYAFLALAVAQALVLALQDHQLHQRHPLPLLRALPPLESMETLLFRLIWAGFVLLSVTVVSGGLFSEELFGRPLVFSHHVVLSILAWLIFAMLLAGRRLFGWRGPSAIRWTLAGFALLALGYFGTRFVLEVLLAR